MPASNPLERRLIAGVAAAVVTASSGMIANAIGSVLIGSTSTQEVTGLTQLLVTSSGATSAATVSLTISGISTQQISGGTVSMMFGVPAGAGVPAVPLSVAFDPPLMTKPGQQIRVQMAALGTGHAGAHIMLGAKIAPASAGS